MQACLILAGAIHLLPSSGVLGAAQLGALYGITVDGPDLAILMRHRAALFGIVGLFLVAAAVRASLRNAALLVALASVSSFLVLALMSGRYNPQIARVVAVDAAALALLLGAAAVQLTRDRPR